MKLIKQTVAFLLLSLLLLSVCACGNGDQNSMGGNQGGTTTTTASQSNVDDAKYQQAINDLRALLDASYSDEELAPKEIILDIFSYSETDTYPIAHYQKELAELYERFSSFGDYKQAKEITDRFTVVKNGFVVVDESNSNTGVVNKNIGTFILDGEGRRILVDFDCHYKGGTYYLYDEDGRLIRGESNNYYEYDETGRLVRETSYLPYYGFESKYMIAVYTYDDAGRCIEKRCSYNTAVVITFTYTYDENGVLVRALDYYARQGVTTKRDILYDYVYGVHGNSLMINQHRIGRGNFYGTTNDIFEIYSEAGNLLFQYERSCGGEECPTTVTEYVYEDGLPLRILFSNETTLTFNYSNAYLFDETGLTLE